MQVPRLIIALAGSLLGAAVAWGVLHWECPQGSAEPTHAAQAPD